MRDHQWSMYVVCTCALCCHLIPVKCGKSRGGINCRQIAQRTGTRSIMYTGVENAGWRGRKSSVHYFWRHRPPFLSVSLFSFHATFIVAVSSSFSSSWSQIGSLALPRLASPRLASPRLFFSPRLCLPYMKTRGENCAPKRKKRIALRYLLYRKGPEYSRRLMLLVS